MGELSAISGRVSLRLGREEIAAAPMVMFDHVESIHGGSRWKLVLKSLSFSDLAVLTDSQESRVKDFAYKLAFDGSIDIYDIKGQETEWYRGVVVKSFQDMVATGTTVTLLGTDPKILMQGRSRTKPWRATFPVLARQIARQYGVLNLDIDPPTEKEPPVYWQYGENDWDFLDRTRKQLVSSRRTGRADYEMWFSEGTILNIKPPGAEGRARKIWKLSQEGLDWRIKKLRSIQRKRALQAFGGVALQGIGFDPLTKEAIVFDQTPETSTEKPRMALRQTLEPTSSIPASTIRSVASDLDALKEDVKSAYGERFRRMYLLEADVIPEFRGYAVGDVVTFQVDDSLGDSEPNISGNYLIEARRTRIVGAHVRMKLLLSRHGSSSGDTRVTGRSYDQPATERQSDGRFRRISGII